MALANSWTSAAWGTARFVVGVVHNGCFAKLCPYSQLIRLVDLSFNVICVMKIQNSFTTGHNFQRFQSFSRKEILVPCTASSHLVKALQKKSAAKGRFSHEVAALWRQVPGHAHGLHGAGCGSAGRVHSKDQRRSNGPETRRWRTAIRRYICDLSLVSC